MLGVGCGGLYGVRCEAEFLPGAPRLNDPYGESGAAGGFACSSGTAAGSGASGWRWWWCDEAADTTAEDTDRKNLVGVPGLPAEEELWLEATEESLGEAWGRRAPLKDLCSILATGVEMTEASEDILDREGFFRLDSGGGDRSSEQTDAVSAAAVGRAGDGIMSESAAAVVGVPPAAVGTLRFLFRWNPMKPDLTLALPPPSASGTAKESEAAALTAGESAAAAAFLPRILTTLEFRVELDTFLSLFSPVSFSCCVFFFFSSAPAFQNNGWRN